MLEDIFADGERIVSGVFKTLFGVSKTFFSKGGGDVGSKGFGHSAKMSSSIKDQGFYCHFR